MLNLTTKSYFKALSLHLAAETSENTQTDKKPQRGQPISDWSRLNHKPATQKSRKLLPH
jgi:hypothetical protein